MRRPFPARQIRDALGLVRLLYVTEEAQALPDDQARGIELADIGRALALVVERRAHPDSLLLALVVLERLEDLGWPEPQAQLVRAAGDRVRGGPRAAPSDRDRAKDARRARG